MRKIGAVTFDLWDTLIQELPGGPDKVAKLRIDRMAKLLGSRGMPHSADDLEGAYERTGEFLRLTWSKRRDVPVRDQVLFMLSSMDAKLASRLGKDDLAEMEKVYVDGLLDNPPMLLPGAKEALRALKARAFKIGLISNTGRTPGSTLRVLMGRMGILEYFDATTFSNEILVRKPAPSAFRFTLEKLRVLPKASVHVGDNPEADVVGAKKAGMYAIQLLEDGSDMCSDADGHVRSLGDVVDMIERL
ncbi:MAG: hypothetical protein A3K67_02055 [Euryarchaeota archaeon RBG_16_62_10]|nr:MAG: hypothetical protein A3K67_02055 [Euryarchaeota archaeon RBG_16_62_10]